MNRVLHVEDEPDIREVALMALELVGGMTVAQAGSGKEGLSQAISFAPELILMDVMMPGMDGPSTLAELRKCPQTASIPVIFMTAKVQSQEVERYRAMGAIDVIAKPFDPMTLSDQIREIWNRSHAA